MSENNEHTALPDIEDAVAIIGMAGRFPGAQSIGELWHNIKNGVESIRFFSDEELLAAGISQEEISKPNYVKGKGFTEGAELFDAQFFSIIPSEARIIDPQQRMFLECAWESLEDASCVPDSYDGLIGVYAGVGMNQYLLNNLIMNPAAGNTITPMQLIVSNDKDYLATRLSYKLNLRGPSIVIQSACSSSLLSIQLACQGLLNYQCDVALSGGAFLTIPRVAGYEYNEAHILSPDGHCRAFDENASGTNFGDGVGVVTLKRLEDAIEDRDNIYAVIRGMAVNNDGSNKIGYTAPSVQGQSDVIKMAHSFAGTEPDSISYIEAHGTGTRLGDPIEIAGLKEAFSSSRRQGKYCAIGSLKANIGHLDVAAGVAGVIKTALALYHKTIPVSVNYTKPNPKLEIESSPFYISDKTKEWEPLRDENGKELPRRAGVSSFGVGGTNVHGILEEYPSPPPPPSENRGFLLPLSAKNPTSLDAYTTKLADFFEKNGAVSLADAAYTLQTGRQAFDHRRFAVCTDGSSASGVLKELPSLLTGSAIAPKDEQTPVFMFTGQGSQYVGMGKELYESNAVFRDAIDMCAKYAQPLLNLDLRDLLFAENDLGGIAGQLKQTAITQPALFSIEYALAQVWLSLGIKPMALIGHSIGECTAACIAGVMSPEDTVTLVCHRGRLMQSMPKGSMLSVKLPEAQLREHLTGNMTIGVINSHAMCVVSGTDSEIDALEQSLGEKNITARRLHTSHAFHSAMMDPILDDFIAIVNDVALSEPSIPFISNVTGTWITPREATDSNYWAQHLRQTVRFADGITTLMNDGHRLFLEVGPGNTLASLARQHAADSSGDIKTVQSLPHPKQDVPDFAFWLSSVGNLWAQNVRIEWNELYGNEERRHIHLPTYAFDRQRHWIDPDPEMRLGTSAVPAAACGTASVLTDQPFDTVAAEAPAKGPQTPADIIRAIWQEMLGIGSIATDDNFFDLGGDSIWASQVINRINEHFSLSLPQNTLFNSPTIGELLKLIETVVPEESTEEAEEGKTASELEHIPLSFSQKRLWFLHQFAPESPAFNLAITLDITGPLKRDSFEQALQDVVNRHDNLRSTITDRDGVPEIIIRETLGIQLEYITLDHLSEEEANGLLYRSVRDKNVVPYDLGEGPLFRLALYKLSDERHIFLLMVHHIIFDGWSWGVFISEVGECYKARLNGASPNLPQLDIQYQDYASWQQDNLPQRDMHADSEYWQQRLLHAPPVWDMPLDMPRPSVPANTGGLFNFTLEPEITAGLKDICTRERVTMFTLLQAAFKVLIYRYSGQNDILIGSPVANRNRSADEKLIGLFINMVVLRSDVNGNQPFSEFLKIEHKNVIEAMGHREYPFERVIDDLKLKRNISVHPVYQVMFAFQNFAMPTVTVDSVTMRNIDLDRNASQLDLWLFMYQDGNRIKAAFEYDDEIFTRSTIERMAGHLIFLLESLARDISKPIDTVGLMTGSEINLVTDHWNQTHSPYPKDKCIIELFEEQAQSTPDAIAAISGDESITYSELDKQANCVGNYLIQHNLGQEDLVGICLPRSIDMLVGVLGILKAGCAYLPIDKGFPKDRIKFMLDDADSSLVITVDSLAELFDGTNADVLKLDSDDTLFRHNTRSLPPRTISPSDRSYVIYTSGSTGTPKGVEVINSAVVNLIHSLKRTPGLDSTDTLLAVTSMTFDVSIADMFLPLAVGAKIVIASSDDVADGVRLVELVKKHTVTAMPATPVTWRIMSESGWADTPHLKAFCAGEALTEDLARAILKTGTELWNIYGPTEATVYASLTQVTNPKESSVIGYPVDNTQLYVLDKTLKPVPIGVPGELFIAGDGLARGYLKRPELTEKAYLTVQLDSEDGKRLYKTGDKVKRLQDGRIDFLGRIDNQVKIRGYRIEIGEIEASLNNHESVLKSVVVVHTAKTGDKSLVAYIMPDGGKIVESEMKDFLGKSLPNYMIPSHFVELDKLPLTTSGKVDRKNLENREIVIETNSALSERPRDEIEQQLVDIWQYILDIKPVSIHDDFFNIGGDSLIAARLFAVISKRMGINLPLALLFQNPTIAGIADSIRTGGFKSKWSSLVPIRIEGDKPGLFLVHGAEGNVIIYRDLAKYIEEGIPLYGLQSKGLSDGEGHTTIEEMAAHYIKEIKTVQPTGPYHLAGYCMGGSIIFEMAQQLRSAGDEVGMVGLLESYNVLTIDYPGPFHVQKIKNIQNLWFHFLNMLLAPEKKGGWSFFLSKLKTERKRFASKSMMLYSTLLTRLRIHEKQLFPHIEVTNANHHAQIKYRPQAYSGELLVLRTPKTFYLSDDHYFGWKDVAKGGIDVVNINVYPHGSLTEPYVKEVGKVMMNYMDRYNT